MTKNLLSRKRRIIINAATRLFLTKGYRMTSMDEVAKLAPVSKATLYSYFENKKTLLAGVVTELCESFIQTLETSRNDSADMETTLKMIARSFVDLIYSENALAIYRLVISESREFPELSQLFYNSGPRVGLQQLDTFLQTFNIGDNQGHANPDFPTDAFFSLLKGDLHMQCLLRMKSSPSESDKQVLIDQAVSFYLRGINHVTQ